MAVFSDRAWQFWQRWHIVLVSVFGISALTYWSILQGQDQNWDLRNYHYSAVYRLLNNRLLWDIAPSQIQSWFNPFPYIPYYIAIRSLPPIVSGSLMAIVAGINIVLVYALTLSLFKGSLTPLKSVTAIAATLIGATAPMFLSEVGTTFIDNVMSLFIVGAGLILIRMYRNPDGSGDVVRAGWAGLLLGIAFGFKQTVAVFIAGLVLATVVTCLLSRRSPVRPVLGLFVGGLVGTALSVGWWSYFLFTTYGNPLFPFYNKIFQSPYFPLTNFIDVNFLPKSFMAAVGYPIQWALGNSFVSCEMFFRDFRFVMLYALLAVGAVFLLRPVRAVEPTKSMPGLLDRNACVFLFVFFVFSYVAWISMFAIHRYLVPLEILTGAFSVMLLAVSVRNRTAFIIVVAILTPALVLTTIPASWGRSSFGRSWFDVRGVDSINKPDTLYVVVEGGGAPLGYVIPFFGKTSRFVRIAGNMMLTPGVGLGASAKDVIDNHKGPIRSLQVKEQMIPEDLKHLRIFGLEPSATDCGTITTKFDVLQSCQLERVSPPAPGGSASVVP
ncbi:ArnT family glycosyltransferase [Azospirillum argentinense]|uniref:ArnT family glycosyltransferase n=1 Tax=Azospirillum argentinense TaxID=2970906 RepID=UPI001586DA02|nr:glycosyltransferase 87 family protein [Azospirillum argentinense]